jgi:hypothetical protein
MIGFRGASVTTVILQGFALNVPWKKYATKWDFIM